MPVQSLLSVEIQNIQSAVSKWISVLRARESASLFCKSKGVHKHKSPSAEA